MGAPTRPCTIPDRTARPPPTQVQCWSMNVERLLCFRFVEPFANSSIYLHILWIFEKLTGF
jgi:hypothetical protein